MCRGPAMRTRCHPARLARGVWAALLAQATLGCASPPPGLDRPYHRVDLPHLQIVSVLPADRTLEIAQRLALFREVVLTVTNISKPPHVSTRLFLLDRETFRRLAPRGAAGFFQAGTRRDVMVMGSTFRAVERQVLQHEYVHFLTANERTANYPLWFNEGWADVLSSVWTLGTIVRVGDAPHGRRELLAGLKRHLPLSEVVTAVHYPQGTFGPSLFYAQSWALVHYLQLGSDRRKDFNGQLERYVGALSEGADPESAFRDAFGWELDALDERLRRYVEKEQLAVIHIPRNRFSPPPEVTVEAMPSMELADELGWVVLSLEDAALADRYFQAALAQDPARASALAGRGLAAAARGDTDEALASTREAVSRDPESAPRRVDRGDVLRKLAESDAATSEQRSTWLSDARAQYRLALEIDPEDAGAALGYGRTFLLEGEDATLGVASLERAVDAFPTHLGARLDLAVAYERIGRRNDARRHLARVMAFARDPRLIEEAEALEEQLASGDARAGES